MKGLFQFSGGRVFVVISLLVLIALTFSAGPTLAQSTTLDNDPGQNLLKGKTCLDNNDFTSAIDHLTAAYEGLPLLGDYALLWRAKAYEGINDIDKAIEDIITLKERYKDSPLLKKAKIRHIELAKKKGAPEFPLLLQDYVKENPSDTEMKYMYAVYLKQNNEPEKAKALFKEIFVTVNILAASAHNELAPTDITAEDLVKRGKNLIKAWHFSDAEKVFQDALQLDNGALTGDILDGLALSVFRQKRYKESAELYKQLRNPYWRLRSLLRGDDLATFEAEVQELTSTHDKRMASVLVAYGTRKRREGNSEGALKVFTSLLQQYPSAKDEILWAIGWTHYLSREYRAAAGAFSELARLYGDSKYLYWKQRALDALKKKKNDISGVAVSAADEKAPLKEKRDFYGYISHLRKSGTLPSLDKKSSRNGTALCSERADMLIKLGLKQEAINELLTLSRKSTNQSEFISICTTLYTLGSYRLATNLIGRIPYSDELHELYYPLGFWTEVEEASKENGIDPLLVLAVMREESRFAQDARSIAGARGLLQLMPQTAQKLAKHAKVTVKHANNLYDPRTNIRLGSYYLKQLVVKFGSLPYAIAAYNAGEDAVKEWLNRGNYATVDEFIEDIPYDETRNYVKKVLTSYFEYLRSNANGNGLKVHKKIGKL